MGSLVSILDIQCQIFDPVRITTLTRADAFIIDTWYETGLIARSLYDRLPGIETVRTGKLLISSGMTIDRPVVRVGVQINNIRALPVEFFVVDDGPAPLLLGSDFLGSLFNISHGSIARRDAPSLSSLVSVSVESRDKYDPASIGIRLVPEGNSIDGLQLERFLHGIRAVHNVAVIANSYLHRHEDWPHEESHEAKRRAVRETIENDNSLSDADTLKITWIEAGSIWLSLKTGSKAALSWIGQLFEKSMDARLRSTIAAAASAEEDAEIKRMTRAEVANAKNWEAKRLAAEEIRRTREEWRKMVLNEIDFKKKLAEKIDDVDVRKQAEQSLEKALRDLLASDFMPVIEHIPLIPGDERDSLPTKKRQR
jgi:hypothetical protein